MDYPLNMAVITTRKIIEDKKTILYVSHDLDGYWQFHDGLNVNLEDSLVVSLAEILNVDNSIQSILHLEFGWAAFRGSKEGGWEKFINEEGSEVN